MARPKNRVSKVGLPAAARRYLRSRKDKKARTIVRRLYSWMTEQQLVVEQLEPWHLDQLLERPFTAVLAKRTRYDYRGELLRYLELLYAKGQLSFDPSRLRRGKLRRRPLPELADQFVQLLTSTHRPTTCRTYRTYLRRFCYWLKRHEISLDLLDRQQMSRWLLFLKQRGLHATSRAHNIGAVRIYLRWLYEQGLLRYLPDLLLRHSDFPKRPTYLPRPICPEADRQLQTRLQQSSCRYAQGLLLMRYTGLRIGELRHLRYHCLRTDVHGSSFLKVPLGKLNNDRLVPLDAKAVELVLALQKNGSDDQRWLIQTPSGKQTYDWPYRRELKRACLDINTHGAMTPHRLRHTYATSLISGGMSLVGVMKLLGHRSYHTTLRYAAVTQETIGKEYFEALRELEGRYQQPLHHGDAAEFDPIRALSDVARWINNLAQDQRSPHLARRLIKRIDRLKAETRALMPRDAGV